MVLRALFRRSPSANPSRESARMASTTGRRQTNSQMPRRLISDAHEWINEIPIVPKHYLAKPQPGERKLSHAPQLFLSSMTTSGF